jgi:hypothetical protein
MMTKQELLTEIQEALSRNVAQQVSSTPQPMSKAQFEQMLLEKGIINQIPAGIDEEEEDFEPVLVEGKPRALSLGNHLGGAEVGGGLPFRTTYSGGSCRQ